MSGIARRGVGVGLLFWLLLQSLAPSLAAAVVAFTVTDPRVTSPVGFALDPADYVFWTANAKDTNVTAYAVDYAGVGQAKLSLGRDTGGVGSVYYHDRKVYLADFGTPNVAQKGLRVYWTSARLTTAQVSAQYWDFTYPDNSYIAAAIMVDQTGRLFVVCKGAAGAIYVAPQRPAAGGTSQLTRVASAPRDVTSGLFLSDGRIALRTSQTVEILDPKSYQTVARALVEKKQGGPLLAHSASGTHLLLVANGPGAVANTMNVPTTIAEFTPAATPTAEPTPSESATPSPAPAITGTTFGRTGTIAVIAGAAALAFLAGAFVLLRR